METNKKLRRSDDDSMIAGVCAGLADFFGLDVSLVRIAYVLLTCCTAFAGIPIYILMWVIIPRAKNEY
ncbi:MAG TPA: PspC domain-containing protein [Candidatus Phocaeicola gallistercoris]|jgi:phage shock protein PspC (stress-responsive transcriptional regulator)|nr:PspC domain-containing protein [Candidatus Phocaeicola gallistercoris]